MLKIIDLSRDISGNPLFKGITLDLQAGHCLAVQGPTGSGKSQFLRSVAHLIAPSGGRLEWDGRTPEQWTIPTWRSLISYVAQDVAPVGKSPMEYWERVRALTVHATAALSDPREIAREWSLDGEKWGQAWSTLSGGEMQRVGLAVAYALKPSVLLLDEPTSALDGETAGKVESFLHGQTMIWVTHDGAQAERVADQHWEMGA